MRESLVKAEQKRPKQSAPALPARMETSGQKGKARNLPTFPSMVLSSPSPPTSKRKRKKHFPREERICQVLERELFTQKKALLRPLFKLTSVVGKFTEEPRNFFQAAGVITLKRNTVGGNLRVWNNLTHFQISRWPRFLKNCPNVYKEGPS